ncbi:MAG: outer membrane protein assembly factor BamA [Planctomycetota bacterium]
MRKLWCEVCIFAVCVSVCAQLAYSAEAPVAVLRQQDAGAGQTIAAIRAEGNVNINTSKILAKVRSRQGAVFSPEVATEDTKRIAEIAGVEYCYYNTKPVDAELELTFVVVEKNIIRSIEFVGNKAYRDKKLQEKLGFKVGDYLDPVLAQTYTTTIAEFYRKNSFPYTEVSLDTAKTAEGKLIYTVNEGPRVKIAAVGFAGNKAIKSSELKKIAKTRPRTFLVFQKYYQEDRLAEDVSKLQQAYQKRGFLNAKIEAKRQFNEDKTKVRIIFTIEEGIAYSVEQIVFTGNVEYNNEKLYEQLSLQKGQTYNEQKAESDTKRLVKTYKENGFIEAQVERSIKFVSDKTIAVEYNVKEGRRFRIGQIIITGNEGIKDKVVRRVLDEYDFQPGDWYNADIAHGDGKGELERILQRSLLTERDGATITPAQTPAEGQKDARVNIIEGRTGMVMLGAGVSSDAGIIGQLTFEQRNFDITDTPESFADFIMGKAFKGAGQTLRISLQPGTQISQYSVNFTEPYLNDKPTSLDLAGSSWGRWRESYDEQRTKGFVGLEKRYKDKWRRSIGFRAENVNVRGIDYDAPIEIKEVEGGNFLAGVRLGVSRNIVDNMFNPSTGHGFDISYEQVGGDHTFGIASATYRKYYTLYEDLAERKTVLAAKLLGATTVGSAPPFEKFYAGGTGTYGIRGFQYRGVSTRGLQTNIDPNLTPERKDPIGSDWIFIANAEVTIPLVGENVSALFFIDSGAIDTGDYRVGAGAGIQIMIPQWFGPVPMRFELAAPLMKSEGDETQAFSFSVGTLF